MRNLPVALASAACLGATMPVVTPSTALVRRAGSGRGAAYRSSKTAVDALTVFYAQALAGW